MSWKNIGKAGSLFEVNYLPSTEGMSQVSEFLSRVVQEFAQTCVTFEQVVGELPFTYRERQTQSVLLPAIAKVAQAAFVEVPVSRKIKRELRSGRLDYWVYYEPYVFLVEVKQSWQLIGSSKIRESTQGTWKKAFEQLKSISKAEAEGLSFEDTKWLKIAMLIVPGYQASKNAEELKPVERKEVERSYRVVMDNLSPAPNWGCAWALPSELQSVTEYLDGRKEIYPGVGIFTNVESL